MSGRQRLLLIATGGLALAFVIERVFVSSLHARGTTLRQQTVVEEASLRTQLRIQRQKAFILNEDKTYDRYALIPSQDRKAIAKLLREAEQIAKVSGVTVLDLTPEKPSGSSRETTTYQVQLRAEGRIDQLLTLFYKIQTNQFLIRLDRFSLSPKDDQATLLRLDTTITMLVLP
ncbi:MAG: hypothetical protein HYY59_02430 [Candidatus Omnitrophica bacterium]|nr:hypothetical protein [Candidatus Omnitrophota bacterium]MBI3020841.1 hypothetical protein [Candidatus Omnitrophota bacterium]